MKTTTGKSQPPPPSPPSPPPPPPTTTHTKKNITSNQPTNKRKEHGLCSFQKVRSSQAVDPYCLPCPLQLFYSPFNSAPARSTTKTACFHCYIVCLHALVRSHPITIPCTAFNPFAPFLGMRDFAASHHLSPLVRSRPQCRCGSWGTLSAKSSYPQRQRGLSAKPS